MWVFCIMRNRQGVAIRACLANVPPLDRKGMFVSQVNSNLMMLLLTLNSLARSGRGKRFRSRGKSLEPRSLNGFLLTSLPLFPLSGFPREL